MSSNPIRDESGELRQTLSDLKLKLQIPQISEKIWKWVVRPDEQAQLTDDFDLRKLTKAFADLRGCSHDRAIVDLALKASLLDAGGHQLLRNRIGEPVEAVDDRPRPQWDSQQGELHFRGRRIRSVSVRASNLRKILDAFEEDGWPPHINNPLPGGAVSKTLRDAVYGLNEGLEAIEFRADNTAEGVFWAEV